MATPTIKTRAQPRTGEEVVISGISGIYPRSANTSQFLENLYNNVDMVTEINYGFRNIEAPQHIGHIEGINKFDAQFFRLTYYHALTMEPVSRKLLEQAYTAIYDSGINPLELKGKKVGVFIGNSFSDISNVAMFTMSKQNGYILSGCAKSMFSNRISNFIDLKGPSYTVDCGSASTAICLEHAYQSIAEGECEAAIVGGGNICILPQVGLNLRKYGLASLDGKTKCFDCDGDGAVRAEAINCIFLQKAKDAKRIYAEVCYSQVTYALKDNAYFFPTRKSEEIVEFLENFYSTVNLSPAEIEYVEAEGSALVEADKNELIAIGEFFGISKNKPVKVGSVKSNMGDSEAASIISAVTKVCLAYHEGKIPANLHCTNPIEVPAIKEGKIQIVQKNEQFNRGFSAVNQFTWNGVNSHVLLKGHYKPKDISKYKSNIPRLVAISGRNDNSVTKLINRLGSEPFDPELIGMLHNIYHHDNSGHTSRGYTIIDSNDKNETVTLSQNVQHFSGAKPPLWLVFSGMGSQWPGMAAELMKIPTFAATIQRCHKALEPHGLDLINIITTPDKTAFDKILHCFIGITAVQLGLVDVLKELGVNPDYIIGHSQGETACGYWDDTFTTEETILCSYHRGMASTEANCIKGGMAAIGMGYNDILPLCPSEIDVACHNSNESATISGPADVLKKFVKELEEKGIFVREVPCGNLAFHSRYIKKAAPILMGKLKALVKEPKRRSEKWISTSVPEAKWNEDLAKYSSAEYHTNNLLSPVLFEEASQHIPSNAVIVEVAPHGLLQAILKRSHPECTHIPLTRRGHENPIKFFFEAVGKLYQQGYGLTLDALYPKIQFPVSTETKMISHYVDWDHSETWGNSLYNESKAKINSTYREFVLAIHSDDFKYIAGHVRDGQNVYPESGILFLAWETLAMSKDVNHKDMSVIFNDVQFHKSAIINVEEPLRLTVMINKGNDYFEILQGNVVLADGYIHAVSKLKLEKLRYDDYETTDIQNGGTNEDNYNLKSDDLYEHLHARGLTYKHEFQSIKSTNTKYTTSLVKWNNNWITFIDSLIQLNILANDSNGIIRPKIIKKLTLSTEDFKLEKTVEADKDKCYTAKLYSKYETTRCAGVEIKQIVWETKQNKQREPDVLESLVFVPHLIDEDVTMEEALKINLQIVAENILDEHILATEVLNDSNLSINDIIKDVAQYIPNVKVDVETVKLKNAKESIENSNLVIFLHLNKNGTNTNDILNKVNKHAFILTFDQSNFDNGAFNKVSSINVRGMKLVLFRHKNNDVIGNTTYLAIKDDETFKWVSTLKSELPKTNNVVLVSENQPHCGLIGFVKTLRKAYPNKIGLIVVDDFKAPIFDQNNEVYKEQLQKGLAFNILHKGQWGNYYYIRNKTPIYTQNFKLTNVLPSGINGLKWAESPVKASENVVQVHYAGPSPKDSQKATGMIKNDEDGYGYDFSGYDTNGRKVMGVVSSGAISTTLQADPHLLWQVPESWSLEDAATVPLPFVQALYALVIRGQLQRGQSVFVTDGDEALGQAVISIALYLECNVYTSVDSPKKKQFLLRLFPKLNEANICISQNEDFYIDIQLLTKGRGTNFVISTTTGYQREMAMKCVSGMGIFMDFNEYDSNLNKPFGMSFISAEKNYMAVMFSSIFKTENLEQRKMLQWLVAEGIKNGSVRPLTRVVYSTTEAPRVFRLLTSKRHTGRVLFDIRNTDTKSKCLDILPRINYSPCSSYVIVCDETTLGIHLTNHLINHGARNIMLHQKSKTISGFMHMKFASWSKLETRIKISTENLHSDKNCAHFLKEASSLGQVQGIFIIQETKNSERWNQQEFVAKHEGFSSIVAKLDVISRNNCPELSEFVVISRASQNAVDEYMTSVADQICEDRFNNGLPAVSLKIALLEEIKTDISISVSLSSENLRPQNITTVFNALEKSIKQKQHCAITFNLKKYKNDNFLNKVMRYLDLENLDDMESTSTINDLVKNNSQLREITNLIQKTFKIQYDIEKLKELPIASLNELSKQNNKFSSKLGAFYTFVDQDEYMATNPMIPMETMFSKNLDLNEMDENAAHILLVPGFEGHYRIFETLCETLKIRAMTLQLGPDDSVMKSIQEIAKNMLQLIKKNFIFQSKFYLMGYSFGVNVALELAALLEKEGHIGLVYCLDSSPDALKVQLNAYIGKETGSQLENSIIKHFVSLFAGENSIDLTDTEKLDDWCDKLDICVNKLKKVSQHSHQYIRNTIDSAYRRILLAKNYTPNIRLESELILLKGLPHAKSENLDSDYGLSKYTKKPVKVINITSDHASAPQDIRISNIVNRFIEPDHLEKKINSCYTYSITQ